MDFLHLYPHPSRDWGNLSSNYDFMTNNCPLPGPVMGMPLVLIVPIKSCREHHPMLGCHFRLDTRLQAFR